MMCNVLNKRTGGLLLAALLFSVTAFAEGLPPLTHGMTKIEKPFPAPPLKFKNMDDAWFDLGDMKGKTVIVNFWATWCPPCRREMASLEHLHQAVNDKNVVIVAVNIGEDLDTVFSFLGLIEPTPTYPIAFDTNADSMSRWKVRGLPTTYIVDPAGQVTYRIVGGREFDHPEMMKAIIKLAPR